MKRVSEHNSSAGGNGDVQVLNSLFNKGLVKYNRLSRDRVTENVPNRLRLYTENIGNHMKSSSSSSGLLSITESNVSDMILFISENSN
jgi:hypothetical protein